MVFAVYAAVTLYVALHHEPWRDEADAWLLMRDGGTHTMLSRTGYIGMPALWHLLVAPLPKLGLPYVSMTLLNLVIAWAAALLFLIAAPFPKWMRAAFVFSYYLLYEYAILARPYALLVLFLFAALAAWRHRHERPWLVAVAVALLANTTPHGLVFAAIFGALFVLGVRRQSRRPGAALAIAIMLGGGLLSVVQLKPPADASSDHVVRQHDPRAAMAAIGGAFFPRVTWYRTAMAGGVFVLLAGAFTIGRRVVPQLFLWTSLAALGLIFTFVWIGGLRHSGLIALALVVALWLSALEGGVMNRAATLAIGASLLVSIGAAVSFSWQEIGQPFSGSKEVAEFIKANGLEEQTIAVHRFSRAEAVLPWLPKTRFYYAALGDYGSYMKWDATHRRAARLSNEEAVELARTRFGEQGWLMLVSDRPLKDSHGMRLLFTNRERPFGRPEERYWLYAAEGR